MKAEAQGRRVLAGILDEARRRVAEARAHRVELERAAAGRAPAPSFAAALAAGREVAVVAEIKRRSPSAGTLRAGEAAPLGRELAAAGAAALSVLTEPRHFGGSLADLEAVARAVALPVLRKDFVVDELQVLEARAHGAAAVLLIARLLGPPSRALRGLLAASRGLGLEALVEVHDDAELEAALEAGARVVGVNARDLDTLAMDPRLHDRLLPAIPSGVVAVAESGLARREDVERVAARGADAVLIGAAISGAADPARALAALARVPRRPRGGGAPGGRAA